MVGFLEGQKSAAAMWHLPPDQPTVVLHTPQMGFSNIKETQRRSMQQMDRSTADFYRHVHAAEQQMGQLGQSGQFVHQVMDRLNRTFNGTSEDQYDQSAGKIQSVYRGRQQRRLSKRERAAASLIQRCWRGRRDRVSITSIKMAAEALEMERAATMIQGRFRGMRARRLFQTDRDRRDAEEMERGAARIQASYRGLRGRRSGEAEREYVKRVMELEKKAMRMFTNRQVGGAFTLWHAYYKNIREMKKKAIRKFAGGALVRSFDIWKEEVLGALRDREAAVLEAINGLIDQLVAADPEERLRQELMEHGGFTVSEIVERIAHQRDGRMAAAAAGAELSETAPPEKMVAQKAASGGLWSKLTGRLKTKPLTAGIQLRTFATRRANALEASNPLLAAQNKALGADINNSILLTIEVLGTLNIPGVPANRPGRLGCSADVLRLHKSGGDAEGPPLVATGRTSSVLSKALPKATTNAPLDGLKLEWGKSMVLAVDDVTAESVQCFITEGAGMPKLGQFSIGLKGFAELPVRRSTQ